MKHFQLINMVILQKAKKAAMRFSLSFLFVFGSLSLCHAQGVVEEGSESSALDIQESAAVQKSSVPLLTEWQASYDKMDAAVTSQLAMADAP